MLMAWRGVVWYATIWFYAYLTRNYRAHSCFWAGPCGGGADRAECSLRLVPTPVAYGARARRPHGDRPSTGAKGVASEPQSRSVRRRAVRAEGRRARSATSRNVSAPPNEVSGRAPLCSGWLVHVHLPLLAHVCGSPIHFADYLSAACCRGVRSGHVVLLPAVAHRSRLWALISTP